jgi:hypothetical protein
VLFQPRAPLNNAKQIRFSAEKFAPQTLLWCILLNVLLVIFLMRNQAIRYVNEIKIACDTLSSGDMQLIEVKRDMAFAVGYTILIRSFLGSVCKHQVACIADKYRLAMEEEHDGLLIYQPKKALQ